MMMGVTICSWVLFNVLFSSISEKRSVIVGIATLAIANNIGSYIAPILGGYLIDYQIINGIAQVNFSNLPTAKGAVAFLLLSCIFSLFLKKSELNGERNKLHVSEMIDMRLILISTIGLVITFIKYATLKYSFETAVLHLGGSPMFIGNIDAHYDVLHILGGFAGAWLVNKERSQYMDISTAVQFGVLIMSFSALMCYTDNIDAFLLFNLVAGFGMGMAYILLMSNSITRCDPKYKNSRMGFFQAMYMVGIYFAPKVCEYIFKTTNGNMMSMYLACAIIGIFTLMILSIKTVREQINGKDVIYNIKAR
jgi:predicted MFS family arabinose efflux permease